jgi:integral membrane protein (TIGR01906 family)
MQKFLRVAAMAAGVFLLAVFSAISVFLNTACDGGLYYEIQQDLSVECGVDDETLMELDLILGRYLAGNADALDETELFNADEKAHMVDVYNIFSTLRLIKNGAFAISVLILVWAYYNRQKFTRGHVRLGVISGAALFFLPLVCVAAWAAVDFDAAFTAMHHMLFSNDLWLMDPRTDLMIRLLPERFFVSMGTKLAVRTALGAIAIPAVVFIGTLDFSKLEKKSESPKND